jgi:prepilin-type N-terminal cleavage/methylation domain-containing protein
MGTNTMRKQQGFTLIEIAIVLVIIGLLLGGVLKGQELINAARVRNIASQLDGVKIAYLGISRSLPRLSRRHALRYFHHTNSGRARRMRYGTHLREWQDRSQ